MTTAKVDCGFQLKSLKVDFSWGENAYGSNPALGAQVFLEGELLPKRMALPRKAMWSFSFPLDYELSKLLLQVLEQRGIEILQEDEGK